jgi:predicted DNA-binding ribbon-helix-helix protein
VHFDVKDMKWQTSIRRPIYRPRGEIGRRRQAGARVTVGRGSSLARHNIVVAGHRTTVRLEPVLWDALRDIARRRQVTVDALLTEIDSLRTTPGLTSAIRVYVVEFYHNAVLAAAEAQVPTPRDQ